MAKEELDRASISASDAAVNVKQQDVALLLKKKNAAEQQVESTEAEAHVEQAAVVAQEEALMVASADSVFASDGAYMVAQAGGAAAGGAAEGGLSTGTLLAIGGVALVAGGIAIAASDDGDDNKSVPTTVTAGAASVNEGSAALFNVTGNPGETLTYTITGVQAEDVQGGVLTGTVTLDSNGNGVIAVQLLADNLTEGAETLTVTVNGVSASTTVTDSSVNQPQNLTSAVETVDGTDAADVFNGSVTAGFLGPITGETLNAGDIINGLGGDDTLNIDFQGSPVGGAVLADVTTNSVETINASFNTLSGGQGNAIDAVTFNDVENFNVRLQAPNSDGSLDVLNLAGALETLTIDGNDVNVNLHSSSFDLDVIAGAQPLTIASVSVSDLFGSFDVQLAGLGNIPVLNLSNVSQNGSGSVSVTVDAAVAGNDSLTLNANNAGVISFSDFQQVDISVENTDGDDVLENLTLTLTGNNNLEIRDSSVLETVTISGTGAGLLSFSSDTSLVTIDASGLQGDLELDTLSNSNDMTITLGSGNDYVHSHLSGDVVVDTGAGNDWFEQHSNGSVNIVMGTGNDLFVHSSSSEVTLDLGEGDDIYIADGNLSDDDTIEGGDGIDMLAIGAGDFNATDLAGVSGFEVLATASNGTYDLDLLDGITGFVIGGFDSYGFGPSWFHDPADNDEFFNLLSGGTVSLLNVGAVASLTVNNDQTSITLERAVDNGSNALTVVIGNSFDSEATSSADSVTIGALIANDEETITVNSIGDDDGELIPDDLNVITTLTAGDLRTLVVTGDTDLEITNAIASPLLTKIDASAFTGDLTIAAAPGANQAVQFIGGTGVDTYNGTAFGDTVNGGAGNDVFNFDAGNANEDTLILEAGDALIDGNDVEVYTGFNVGEDTIDLGAFGFTGNQASGLADQSARFNAFNNGNVDADTVIADFFADTGVDRGVAVVTNGTDTFVVIDANKDGNFQGATDLVIFLDGVDGNVLAVSDFGF
ncbi:MAG TPA: hypothetical protein VGE57_04010 [Solimonas sp.]